MGFSKADRTIPESSQQNQHSFNTRSNMVQAACITRIYLHGHDAHSSEVQIKQEKELVLSGSHKLAITGRFSRLL
jgi:hypothetical protein